MEPKLYAAAKPEVRTRIVESEKNRERGNSKQKVIKTSYFGMLTLTGFLGPLYREQNTQYPYRKDCIQKSLMQNVTEI